VETRGNGEIVFGKQGNIGKLIKLTQSPIAVAKLAMATGYPMLINPNLNKLKTIHF
jgi:hypothetical protein